MVWCKDFLAWITQSFCQFQADTERMLKKHVHVKEKAKSNKTWMSLFPARTRDNDLKRPITFTEINTALKSVRKGNLLNDIICIAFFLEGTILSTLVKWFFYDVNLKETDLQLNSSIIILKNQAQPLLCLSAWHWGHWLICLPKGAILTWSIWTTLWVRELNPLTWLLWSAPFYQEQGGGILFENLPSFFRF